MEHHVREPEAFSEASTNAFVLEAEFQWLETVIHTRMALHFGRESEYPTVYDIPPPERSLEGSVYARFVDHYQMNPPERLVFLLALAPHVKPQLLDVFFEANDALRRGYTEFGGVKGQLHNGFLPTLETALFLLAGGHLALRLELEALFERDHFFMQHKLLKLEPPPPSEPYTCSLLSLAPEVIDMMLRGQIRKPQFSREFPARLLETPLSWDQLVLNTQTKEQLKELEAWMVHEATLMHEKGMRHILKPGYKSLFYGPPGTGKTMTATLLGKRYQKDVYRIDLSTVVSKYIGETEKNLEHIFERVSFTDAILFFDEADALFGKRTAVNEAHDRYANQEVSYLLQRMEDYSGLVILASNFKSNIDDAFMRRFQSVVYFPMPDSQERLRLWQQIFSDQFTFEPRVDLKELAETYKLAGGSIINVVRYASLMALQRRGDVLQADILAGIRRELQKEGKTT